MAGTGISAANGEYLDRGSPVHSLLEDGDVVRTSAGFLVFGAPSLGEAEIAEVTACLRSGWIGPGRRVEKFEQEFGKYKGTRYAIAVNSGTAAIQLSLFGIGIRPGDEVIVPTMTFAPSLHAVIHAGATPVITDCEPGTFNIDPAAIERHITPKTKAILAVHMCGRCCDMSAILALAARHRLRVIEDCAHSIESDYLGQPSGLMGDVGCFSFYATKNLTTGDGGMVITKDRRLYRRMKLVARQGVSTGAWSRFNSGDNSYEVLAPGFRCAMNDIAASIGLVQLARLEERWTQREKAWRAYDAALRDLPLVPPPPPEPGTRHAYHLYTPLLPQPSAVSRRELIAAMRAENIGIGVHYVPVHQQPYFRRRFKLCSAGFPNATAAGERTISLPLSSEITTGDVARVCSALKSVLEPAGRNRLSLRALREATASA